MITLITKTDGWVIGGDGRYGWAARALRAAGIPVRTWGVPGETDDASGLWQALSGAEMALLPLRPFVQEKMTVAGESVDAAMLPRLLAPEATLVAGEFPVALEAWFQEQGVKCISLLEQETYLLKNASITAEGGIYLAMKHMNRTLMGAKVLIIGWGRIGKLLSRKLLGLGSDVTVAVRKPEQKTEATLLGLRGVTSGVYEGGLGGYDLIVNTVPARVLTEAQLQETNRECVLLELASSPGGFPEAYESRVVMGRGLPGKTAPKTAGECIASAVLACLSDEGGKLE